MAFAGFIAMPIDMTWRRKLGMAGLEWQAFLVFARPPTFFAALIFLVAWGK
jgi:hypothetical protein